MHTHQFYGVIAKTGDILFTRDGEPGSLFGEIWKLLGNILPGDLDHAALFLGPGIRFVESAAKGVVVVEMEGDEWDGTRYGTERLLIDELVGVGDPTAGRGISPEREIEIRENVVAYCLHQARRQKPYNLRFFDPESDGAFYCSQLVYKAYQAKGIALHEHVGDEAESLLAPIVLPKDLWNACNVRQRIDKT